MSVYFLFTNHPITITVGQTGPSLRPRQLTRCVHSKFKNSASAYATHSGKIIYNCQAMLQCSVTQTKKRCSTQLLASRVVLLCDRYTVVVG